MNLIENKNELRIEDIDFDNLDLGKFKFLWLSRFNKHEQSKVKLKEVIIFFQKSPSSFDYSKIYYEICKRFQFPPGLDEVTSLLVENTIKEKSYFPDDKAKIHGVNGLWKCKNCHGKGCSKHNEFLLNENYVFDSTCNICKGEGHAPGHNYWDPFLTVNQLEMDPANIKYKKLTEGIK